MTVLHHLSVGTDRPDRTPVVLIGSLGSTLEMWRPQIDALAVETRVIALDNRGHGGSPVVPGPCTVADLAADVTETLDALGITGPGSIDLVGLSLGGAVAQYLSATTDRVRRLALLCTAARFGEPTGWTARAATARTDGMAALASAVVSRWFSPGWAADNPGTVARYRTMVAGIPAEGYASCCDALSTWNFRDHLGEITVPTLTVAGADDPSTPPSTVSVITRGVADGRGTVLSPGAHVPTLERPEEVTTLLSSHFFRDHPDAHDGSPVPGRVVDRLAARAAGGRVFA